MEKEITLSNKCSLTPLHGIAESSFLFNIKVLQLASLSASVRQSEKSVSHMPRDLSGDAACLLIYFLTVALSYSCCLPLPRLASCLETNHEFLGVLRVVAEFMVLPLPMNK